MNIIVNAVLAYEQPRGVGRYINDLLPVLAECDKENDYYIYYGKWMKKYSFINIKQENFHFIELDIKNNRITRNIYLSVILPIKCKKYNPDILFLVDTQAIFVKPCKIVSTIHDLAEYETKEKYSKIHALIRRNITRHQVNISNQIITDSTYSQNDICRIFKKSKNEVHVIYLATNMKKEIEEANTKNYFLFVGEIERAKNLNALIDAYSMLSSDKKKMYSIKVIGKKGNDYDYICKKIKENNIEDNVEFYGYVSDDELNNLYREAYAFVFPSFFEGFGLPVLEAMAKGLPVLCSNSSSIPEVGGEAVLTFSPDNPAELADKINLITDNRKLRDDMCIKSIKRAKEFTYEKTALETLNVFYKVGSKI